MLLSSLSAVSAFFASAGLVFKFMLEPCANKCCGGGKGQSTEEEEKKKEGAREAQKDAAIEMGQWQTSPVAEISRGELDEIRREMIRMAEHYSEELAALKEELRAARQASA